MKYIKLAGVERFCATAHSDPRGPRRLTRRCIFISPVNLPLDHAVARVFAAAGLRGSRIISEISIAAASSN